MIRDLISSGPSGRMSSPEPIDDLTNCGADLSDRELGEEDLIGNSEVLETDKGRGGDGPILDAACTVSDVEVESRLPGGLAAEETTGAVGEKDGGGLTGGASPGNVMDTYCFLPVLCFL